MHMLCLLFIHQIDNILGVWIEDPDKPGTWEHFKQDLNNTETIFLLVE